MDVVLGPDLLSSVSSIIQVHVKVKMIKNRLKRKAGEDIQMESSRGRSPDHSARCGLAWLGGGEAHEKEGKPGLRSQQVVRSRDTKSAKRTFSNV